MKKYFPSILLLCLPYWLSAQHQELHEKAGLWKGEQKPIEDSQSIQYAFKKGTLHGHFRYFFMHTTNAQELSNYYAHAVGGGIKYETAPYKGFQFGVSGFYVFNLASSDLAQPDPKTGSMNRYEIGLFDIQDPHNKHNIDRLEELYLKYSWKQNHLTFGKQLLNTPFLNLQDGRMRPSEFQGIWAEINTIPKTHLEGGFLHGFSPRSTTDWFSTGNSIGLYPSGVQENGEKSNYAGNLRSAGAGMLGINRQVGSLKIQFWDLMVFNIFNTAMLQVDWRQLQPKTARLVAGFQAIAQQPVRDGGNEDPEKAYFNRDSRSYTLGARFGVETKSFQSSLNYNRITAKGRYLMPREWGRDPFFTFMPRERNEGLGDVHALTWKNSFSAPKQGLKLTLGTGYFKLPDVYNYAYNKYGMPSYWQTNLDISYQFKGILEGLQTQGLLAYKMKVGDTHGNDRFVINKVDMLNLNLVINYHF